MANHNSNASQLAHPVCGCLVSKGADIEL